VAPRKVERLMSQVDVPPTLLGLLNFGYASQFLGYDLFDLEPGRERAFVSTYPNLRISVEDTIVEGDKIVARCRVSGTHTGDGIGLAPTEKDVDFTGIAIVRVQDGKIVEAWNEFDFMKMYTQLGVMTLTQ
jgi:predicted ester cyclase